MSEHRATVTWSRGEHPFVGGAFNRKHTIRFEGGVELSGSSAAEFSGDASLPNPEKELAGALASCHMLTFLAIASRHGVIVDSYTDSAMAVLGINEEKRMVVTDIHLNPVVVVGGEKRPTKDELAKLHDAAHRGCFIAGSVNSRVHIHLSD